MSAVRSEAHLASGILDSLESRAKANGHGQVLFEDKQYNRLLVVKRLIALPGNRRLLVEHEKGTVFLSVPFTDTPPYK